MDQNFWGMVPAPFWICVMKYSGISEDKRIPASVHRNTQSNRDRHKDNMYIKSMFVFQLQFIFLREAASTCPTPEIKLYLLLALSSEHQISNIHSNFTRLYYKTVLHVATVFQLLFGDWCPRFTANTSMYCFWLYMNDKRKKKYPYCDLQWTDELDRVTNCEVEGRGNVQNSELISQAVKEKVPWRKKKQWV